MTTNDNDETSRPWRDKLASYEVFSSNVVTVNDLLTFANLPSLVEFWWRVRQNGFKVFKKKLKEKYMLTDDEAREFCDRAASKKTPGKYIVAEMVKANPDFGKLEATTFAHDFLHGVLLFDDEVYRIKELKYAASTSANDSDSE